jgi:hypothetical protein
MENGSLIDALPTKTANTVIFDGYVGLPEGTINHP